MFHVKINWRKNCRLWWNAEGVCSWFCWSQLFMWRGYILDIFWSSFYLLGLVRFQSHNIIPDVFPLLILFLGLSLNSLKLYNDFYNFPIIYVALSEKIFLSVSSTSTVVQILYYFGCWGFEPEETKHKTSGIRKDWGKGTD